MRALIAVALLGGLAGCCAAPTPVAQVCSPLPVWSPSEQDALADEVDRGGPLTRRAVHEWEQLRAAARACAGVI